MMTSTRCRSARPVAVSLASTLLLAPPGAPAAAEMLMGHRACPTEQELAAFNRGDLPESALGTIADHLLSCAR
jgi:hypothetical protein